MGDTLSEAEYSDFTNFDELFIKNHQFLCMIAVNIVRDEFVAKDLVQDFFVKFWLQRNKIILKNFEAYAYRSVKNSCFNYLKHQAVENKHYLSIVKEDQDIFNSAEQGWEDELPEREKQLLKVLQLLNKLPVERRKVFELHVLEGLTYRQIADRLGISINTVKTQLRRAYGTLRGKGFVSLIMGYLTNFL